jgi:hypothetical protein
LIEDGRQNSIEATPQKTPDDFSEQEIAFDFLLYKKFETVVVAT